MHRLVFPVPVPCALRCFFLYFVYSQSGFASSVGTDPQCTSAWFFIKASMYSPRVIAVWNWVCIQPRIVWPTTKESNKTSFAVTVSWQIAGRWRDSTCCRRPSEADKLSAEMLHWWFWAGGLTVVHWEIVPAFMLQIVVFLRPICIHFKIDFNAAAVPTRRIGLGYFRVITLGLCVSEIMHC